MSIYRYKDKFKGNVSMQDTHTQIMSSCKTLQFRKTCLLSLVGRHDLLKDMSSCLKMHFYCFYFLCFILLKTCLFPRHVLNRAPRHDFYSVQPVLCQKAQNFVEFGPACGTILHEKNKLLGLWRDFSYN